MASLNRAAMEAGSTGDEDIAERLSSSIEGYIRQKALDVITQSQTEYDNFTKNVDVETVQYNEALANDYPDEIATNRDKFKDYVEMRDHIYNGPLFLNSNQVWANIVNVAQDVMNLSSLTQNQDGQAILLKRVFSSPEYTIAHVKRDLRILQLCPPKAIKEVEGLSDRLITLASQANIHAETSKKATEEARTETIQIMQGKYEEFKKIVLSALDEELAGRQRLRANLNNSLSKCEIGYESLNTFCKDFISFLESNGKIYTLEINNYISTEADPTRMDVASPFEFEMADIYSKLLNQENVFLPGEFKSQALRARTMPFARINWQQFSTDRSALEDAYNTAYSNEPATLQNRSKTADATLTLTQLRAEKADVEVHPPEFKTVSTSHGGDRSFWTYDPDYLLRVNSAISAKENEIATRFQITRKIRVQ